MLLIVFLYLHYKSFLFSTCIQRYKLNVFDNCIEYVAIYKKKKSTDIIIIYSWISYIKTAVTNKVTAAFILFIKRKIEISYFKNILISSSTLVIPPIPKLSTNTFTTFGERNAGSVGPR